MTIGAVLILTAISMAPSASVSLTAVADMSECEQLRASVALTYAGKEKYEITSIPNRWKTRNYVNVGPWNGMVTLECKPV